MTEIIAGAEPFHFEGNDIGVLVIHGFTGTTQSMRYLGKELNSRFGFTTVGPCLPGHGTSPEDMATTTYLDWLGAVETALHELAATKRTVFVAGLSMGGTLTVNLAARFPDIVKGIAPIAPAIGKLTADFAGVLALNPAPDFIPGIGSDIKAPGVEELAYDQVPVVCMGQVSILTTVTRDLAHNVVCPMLVLHGREDHVVPPENATILAGLVSSNDIRVRWLDNSYHVATLDNDKDLIVDSIGRFFSDIIAS